jgi:hypothetical protein
MIGRIERVPKSGPQTVYDADASANAQPSDTAETAPEWPKPLAAEAFHGPAGEIVRAIDPHTEADLAGLLSCVKTEKFTLHADSLRCSFEDWFRANMGKGAEIPRISKQPFTIWAEMDLLMAGILPCGPVRYKSVC